MSIFNNDKERIADERELSAKEMEENIQEMFGAKKSVFPSRHPIGDILPKRSLTEITAAVDKLELDDTGMINSITVAADDYVRRLRHRATMMQERAQQMHHEADEIEAAQKEVSSKITGLSSALRAAEDILRSHAHVEPRREK